MIYMCAFNMQDLISVPLCGNFTREPKKTSTENTRFLDSSQHLDSRMSVKPSQKTKLPMISGKNSKHRDRT